MAKNRRIETLFDNDKEKSYDIWETVSEKIEYEKEHFECEDYYNKEFAELVKDLKWPKPEEINLFKISSKEYEEFRPLLVHGIVIHTEVKDNKFLVRICDLKNAGDYKKADMLLHLNHCKDVYYSIVGSSAELNEDEFQNYSIGDLNKLQPGKHIVMAIGNLKLREDDYLIISDIIDIAEYDEESYYIDHYINREYKICGDNEYIELFLEELDRLSKETAQFSLDGCYIATAVYGSYNCPQVWVLRRFRDNTLAKHWYGRAFIHFYYAISPVLVKRFGYTEWFKKFWKNKLDCMVEELKNKGVENTPYKDKNWKK